MNQYEVVLSELVETYVMADRFDVDLDNTLRFWQNGSVVCVFNTSFWIRVGLVEFIEPAEEPAPEVAPENPPDPAPGGVWRQEG